LLGFCGTSAGQGFWQDVTPEQLLQVDLDAYADPSFRWNTTGPAQAALNDAITELKEGNVERSVSMLEAAVKLDSLFWPSRYYYAISLQQTGQFREAGIQLERLIEARQIYPEVLLAYGRLWQKAGDLDRAKEQYQHAIKLNPKFGKGYYALGAAYAATNDLVRARKNFDRCLEVDPASVDALFGLAMLKLVNTRKMNNFDMTLLNQVLKIDSAYRPALFWRGFIFGDQGKFEACLQDWNLLIRIAPPNPFLHNMRGYINFTVQHYEDAYGDFKTAIMLQRTTDRRYLTGRTAGDQWVDLQNALHYITRKGYGLQDQTFFHIRKGVCLMIMSQHNDAMTSLDESLRIEQSAPAYLLKAILFEKTHRDDSAQQCYIRAIQYDNDIFDAHKKRALYFVQENDWKNTYKEFNEMKRIDPNANVTYRISGMLKSQFHDYYGCIIDLTRVLKEDTSDLDAWHQRAFCRSQVNDTKGALEDIQNAIRVEPGNKKYQIMLVNLNLAVGDTLAAMDALKKIIAAHPRDCELRLSLSDLQLGTGAYEEAMFSASLVLKNIEEGTCDLGTIFVYVYKSHALLNVGLTQKHHRQFEKALASFTASLQYQQDSEILYQRFLVLLDLNRVDEAKTDLRKLRDRSYGPAIPYVEKYLN